MEHLVHSPVAGFVHRACRAAGDARARRGDPLRRAGRSGLQRTRGRRRGGRSGPHRAPTWPRPRAARTLDAARPGRVAGAARPGNGAREPRRSARPGHLQRVRRARGGRAAAPAQPGRPDREHAGRRRGRRHRQRQRRQFGPRARALPGGGLRLHRARRHAGRDEPQEAGPAVALAERQRLPVVLFAEGGGGRPGDTDTAALTGLDVPTFARFARVCPGSCRWSAWSAAIALPATRRCSAAATRSSRRRTRRSALGGPAMIEGGGSASRPRRSARYTCSRPTA